MPKDDWYSYKYDLYNHQQHGKLEDSVDIRWSAWSVGRLTSEEEYFRETIVTCHPWCL